jgi:hypothetical protein
MCVRKCCMHIRQNVTCLHNQEQERAAIAQQLKARQELLLPLYSKVAEHYADLHDVPARMVAKGCVNGNILIINAFSIFHIFLCFIHTYIHTNLHTHTHTCTPKMRVGCKIVFSAGTLLTTYFLFTDNIFLYLLTTYSFIGMALLETCARDT